MPSYSRQVEVRGKSAQELYDKISNDIDGFMEKSAIGKFDVEKNPTARQVILKSSLVNATLHCEDGRLRLEGNLSLMAMPFRSKIDDGINRWLTKNFPDAVIG